MTWTATPETEASYAAASAKFAAAQDAYRARTIGDAEFIAARKAHQVALAVWELEWNAAAAQVADPATAGAASAIDPKTSFLLEE